MTIPRSSSVAPKAMAETASAIISAAPSPTMCTPMMRSVRASTTTFTKPRVSACARARPLAVKGQVPMRASMPFCAALCWLSPVQVKVLSVSEKSRDYANSVYSRLRSAGIRVEIDNRDEKIGYKIREAQLEKVPYMLVIGEKETENGNIAVRSRDGGDLGSMDTEAFVAKVLKETAERSA